MISLNNYINNWNPSLKVSNEYLYKEIQAYYNEHIPENLIDLYENNSLYKVSFNYITENLKTHDVEKLKKQLLKYYGNEISDFKDYEGTDKIKSFWIILKNLENKNKLNITDLRRHQGKTEDFFNLLNFFNYKYREYEVIDRKTCLFIEPIYSEECSDYFNSVHRQAYHFTKKENVKDILKNGIRLKGKDSSIRYPKRIYLWAGYKKLEGNDKYLESFIKEILGSDKNLDNIGIIKVDLSSTDFPVYKDTAMHRKEAIFVYNNIPPELCKEIK